MHRDSQRWVTAVAGVLGIAFFGLAMAALWSIPRSPTEFLYQNAPNPMLLLRPLPFAPMTGFTPEQLSSHVARGTLLALACILLGWAIASRVETLRIPIPRGRTLALGGALLVALAALFVTRGIPLQDDEPTYLMQTEILAHGRLLDVAVPPSLRFHEAFTIFTPKGTTGKYLFGGPLALLPGYLIGAPVLGHILLVGLTLLLFYGPLARLASPATAALATGMLAASPQFVFTSATTLAQVPSLAGVAIAVWALARGGFGPGFLAGLGIGWAATARPQVAVACGLALMPFYLRKDRRLVMGALAGGAPWLAAILAYDWFVTGSPLRLPWYLYSPEMYGFGQPLKGLPFEFTPWEGLKHLGVVLGRLNGWALGWPLSLAGPAAWFALRCPHRSAVAPWAWIALATFAFQFAYYSPGTSDTGALYHHAALPFICLASASAITTLAQSRHRGFVTGLVLASTLLGTTTFFVEQASRLRRLTDQIQGADRHRLRIKKPALIVEETATIGRPWAGWVCGIPFRDRALDAPVVYYPRTSSRHLEWLAQRYRGRTCYYLFYPDVINMTAMLAPCREIGDILDTLNARPGNPRPGRLYPAQRPPWQVAFRWVPWIRTPSPTPWEAEQNP